MDVFVARQPIFDRSEALIGYELLYRNTATSTTAAGAAADTMCTDTVIHAFLDIGLDQLTDGRLAFINCTRDFIIGGQVELLPANKVVVEVLETVGHDPLVIEACRRLAQKGYELALDDYVDEEGYDEVIQTARIIKLDVLTQTPQEMQRIMNRLRPFNVRWLAERVETQQMHDLCLSMGFDYFQGYYYSRPELVSQQEIEVGYMGMLQLLNLLQNPESEDTDIEHGFRADPALMYKLLRIVNSAAVGGRGVDSITFAIRMVGRQMLYRWLALLMVSSMVTGNGVNDELVYAALLRARLCELIADASPEIRNSQALFMTGLFSMLDVLFRMPMRDVLNRVNVSDEIREAVMEGTGPYAEVLHAADAYQRGDWERVDRLAATLGLLPVQLPWLYTKSLTWVNDQLRMTRESDATPTAA
jgi:EAL and modified HD-GYP domain-containing signal transduction protein